MLFETHGEGAPLGLGAFIVERRHHERMHVVQCRIV
jgi:hypothetical protein